MQSRATLFQVPGGDTIQLLKTKEALEQKGVLVAISLESEPELSGYDLVHVFNLMRPQDVCLQVRNAKKRKRKVVLSTIYGLYTEYDREARTGFEKIIAKILKTDYLEYSKILARAIKNRELNKGTLFLLSHGYRRCQLSILRGTDVCLPNSQSEMNRVINDFSLPEYSPYVVVPNAVDAMVFDPERVKISSEAEKLRDCILCVARIEGRKNQLNLVRAMKGLPYSLVLIGKPAPNHLAYFKQIKQEAGPNVHLLGPVQHDLLPQYYKVAKVHALISWMETPGLSSLEAGAMGCNLVITEKGDTRDYFGDYAYYCEPDSVESIRQAILKAYNSAPNPALRDHILANFTWNKAAEKTIEGYKIALNSFR